MPLDPVAEAWRRRVEAMLAKAEPAQFGPEADALIAKAHQLMIRHSISESMLGEGLDEVSCRPVAVEAPSAIAKSSLLGAIARAHCCRTATSVTGARSGRDAADRAGLGARIGRGGLGELPTGR